MKLVKYIAIFIQICLVTIACEQIPENERLIGVEQVPYERTVILEDYTGQKCINCPNAHHEIEKLAQIYGIKLIPVSIHAGVFSLSSFQTQAGSEYNTFFKVEAYPTGMVNRKKTQEGKFSLLSDIATWQAAIRQVIWEKPAYEIALVCNFNVSDSLLNISATIEKTNPTHHGKISLQLWLIENDITAIQYLPDGSRNKNYVHQHVLREAVNGVWGEEITFNNGISKIIKHDCSFHLKKWNVANCEIVAFVYDTQSYEILEAIRKTLISN